MMKRNRCINSDKSNNYIVIYDISSDSIRNKVCRLLEGYGRRVQKSAFEVSLSAAMLKKLAQDITKLGIVEDSLILYKMDETVPVSFGKKYVRKPLDDIVII